MRHPLEPSRGRSPLNVCFIPYDSRNPYQRQLAAHLRLLGIHVTPRRSFKGFLSEAVRGVETSSVVHLHWLPVFQPNLSGAIRALMFWLRLIGVRLLGRRIIWTVHNLYAHESKSRRMEHWVARCVIANASLVITHSETARNLVMREFLMDNKRPIVVVPHGNYTECYENTVSAENARTQLELEAGSVVFLFFGNIRPYKGVPELIEAYQSLQSSSHSLVIAGRPLNDKTLFDVERRIENNKRIQLRAGFIPDEDVQVYMNASDVVVFPYQDILTSGAVILAMSFGRACIAPALGCIPDVLDDRGAFLYDPSVPNGLRNAMEKAVQSRALLKQMGEWNRTRAAEWSWGRIAERTADIYDEVTGDRNAAHRAGSIVR